MQSRLLKFTNARGESISFRDGSSFIVSQIDGLGDVSADIQRQRSPFQDGSSYIDSVLSERFINFTVSIIGENDTDISQKRSELSRIFNPKLGLGTLEYRYGDVVRKIEAVPEHVPSFPTGVENRGFYHQVSLVDLICPNPYWQSTQVTEEPAFSPLFEFPSDYWELGDDGDLYFEMGIQRAERIIFNDGDAPAPIQVDFYGPAQSPIIENMTTGEFIRINKQLSENEVFKIDTGAKTLIYVDEEGNETNVFHWIDPDSSFFNLEIGENEISCHCVISNLAKDFDIYYNKLYNAV